MNTQTLSIKEKETLLILLKKRFDKNTYRHPDIEWGDVATRIKDNTKKLWSLNEMEKTGGEPDVIEMDTKSGEYLFYDCSPESPKGRRSLCYDQEALELRKDFPPSGNVLGTAAAMGIELLSEEQYRELQKWGKFDSKTSSWLKTPAPIRVLGGAIFGDFRYNAVFVYHNGASSYYAARGFRGCLRV